MSLLVQQIKDQIASDSYYAQNFANDGERFLAWYLRNVYLRTPIQARDDITDGQDDKEIDAILVDDEKRQIVVMQGKFYTTTCVDHQPLHEVLAAWLQLQNLASLQENANQKLKVKLETVSTALEDDYEIVFELITTGQLTESAKKDLKHFQDMFSDFEHPICSIKLVDGPVIKARWEDAVAQEVPKLSYQFKLMPGKYLSLEVAGFKTVLAAVPLVDCLALPGLHDGLLFRKNVRQSLGLTNKVNRGLKQTITGDTPQFFFLYHNGITALCEKLVIDEENFELRLDGLSVVNGCQSLNTILACSERVKAAKDAHVLFRFYEIPQRDLADKISINTNSQSAVKPRDLRSNDKRVMTIKKAFENTYHDGFFITKRGETRPADRLAEKTVDIALLAKCLMSWHCQRPNIAYNENQLFDKFFDKLFHADYSPVDALALAQWVQRIDFLWQQEKLGLNETLLALPSYSRFHLLFAVQAWFCAASNQTDKVPNPSATTLVLGNQETADMVIVQAANCFNFALEAAVEENKEKPNKVFSPQNWLKNKDSIVKVQSAVKMNVSMIGGMPGGKELREALVIPPENFSLRWVAD
jgi:hypothetical protein